MKVSRERLLSESQVTGFRPEVLEKVIQLLNLLEGFNRHPFLKDRLTLKGGTALNLFVFDLPRLSVDIDLNYIGAVDRETMMVERPKIEQAVHAVCSREGTLQHIDDIKMPLIHPLHLPAGHGQPRIMPTTNHLTRRPHHIRPPWPRRHHHPLRRNHSQVLIPSQFPRPPPSPLRKPTLQQHLHPPSTTPQQPLPITTPRHFPKQLRIPPPQLLSRHILQLRQFARNINHLRHTNTLSRVVNHKSH